MVGGMKRPPPEDEFDVIYREGWAVPGLFIFWVAIVRGWRGVRRHFLGR